MAVAGPPPTINLRGEGTLDPVISPFSRPVPAAPFPCPGTPRRTSDGQGQSLPAPCPGAPPAGRGDAGCPAASSRPAGVSPGEGAGAAEAGHPLSWVPKDLTGWSNSSFLTGAEPVFPGSANPLSLTPAAMLGGGARRETSSPAPSGAGPGPGGSISADSLHGLVIAPSGPGTCCPRDPQPAPVATANPAAGVQGGGAIAVRAAADRVPTLESPGLPHRAVAYELRATASSARGRDADGRNPREEGDVASSRRGCALIDLRPIGRLRPPGAPPRRRRPLGWLGWLWRAVA
jgi:hypothetical protein